HMGMEMTTRGQGSRSFLLSLSLKGRVLSSMPRSPGVMTCSYSYGSDCGRVSRFPCLQVYVSVNNTGRIGRLSHNEEMQDASSEGSPCVYIPRCQKDSAANRAVIVNISQHLKTNQHLCLSHPVVALLHAQVGALIVVMVNLTQYLSRLCEEVGKLKR
uniref:Uncharacterized protein n=1 Tax=Xiphophorus couchianus TaxID=32473 RepID=A0A3B5LG06_9TELE